MEKDMVRTRKLTRVLITIFMYVMGFLWIVPFLVLLKKTLLGAGFENYVYVLTNTINGVFVPLSYLNSFITAFGTCTITLMVAALAGFGFSKLKIKHGNFWFNVVIIGLATPAISVIIPLYFLYGRLGLINTFWSVIIAQTALFTPLAVLTLRNYFDSLPGALLEAGKIDGASNLQAFALIYMPLAKPAIANLSVLVISWSFKEFLMPLIFITDKSKYVATVSVSVLGGDMSSSLVEIGRYNTALLFLAIPPMIIYILGRKFLERGAVSGAVK